MVERFLPMRVAALRHVLLVAFFALLATVEVGHGLFRIGLLRARHRDQVLARTERESSDLANRLGSFLGASDEHAAYLARSPGVRALLDAPDARSADLARAALESWVLPYLVAFAGIDRVRVLDRTSAERFRCERIGSGVGAIPPALLAAAPRESDHAWPPGSLPGEVLVSDLVDDLDRVEVPREDRRVLHYTTAVSVSGRELGLVVVTVYAAPILDLVRRFAPVEGARSMLVDDRGRYLAHSERRREAVDTRAGAFDAEFPAISPSALRSAGRLDLNHGTLLCAQVRKDPGWTLLTFVPSTSEDLVGTQLDGDERRGIAFTVLIIALLAAAAVFFVRLSVRAVRLEEARRKEDLERKLLHAERLSSLGLLTAGVAHEINNPLEGIGNYLALLDRAELDDESRHRHVERARAGVHRIRDIVRDLSAFSRPPSRSETADLARVVQAALSMLAYSREFLGVEVDVRDLDTLPPLAGDAGRLEQVFINLLHNACQALGGKGRVSIHARLESPARDEAARARFAVIEIEDDGPGFLPDTLDKVLDPFFTTREEGSGLGLWISYGIVQAHGGSLRADNRAGGGARLTLRLPIAERATTTDPQTESGVT